MNQLQAIVQYAELTLLQASEFANHNGMPERAEILSRLSRACKPVYAEDTNNLRYYVGLLQQTEVRDASDEQANPDSLAAQLGPEAAAIPHAELEASGPQNEETAVSRPSAASADIVKRRPREKRDRAVPPRKRVRAKRASAPRNTVGGVVTPGPSDI